MGTWKCMFSPNLHHYNVWDNQSNSTSGKRETQWEKNKAGESLPVQFFGEDQQPPLSAHEKLDLLVCFWLWPSSQAGFWLFNHLGSMLWIKQKEIAINIKHKEAAVTGGGTFHVQCRENQQRRTLTLHSKAVPFFLAPKSHSHEGKELKNSKFLHPDRLHRLSGSFQISYIYRTVQSAIWTLFHELISEQRWQTRAQSPFGDLSVTLIPSTTT